MAAQVNAPLPDGTDLSGYRIVKKIASGGFSIVYLAYDAENQAVAIKEYLPSTLAARSPGERVPRVAPEHMNTFRSGMKCFFEEGRSLARIIHPNIVRVLNFFRANDTVYMVMAYESGRSLQEHILRNRGKGQKEVVSERFIRRVFNQVMNGLREVHTTKMLHLDLKPANIYLRHDGTPILLDFGAARRTMTDGDAPKLFPMYTPGFAAPELHKRNGELGPWSDVYGLGASLFACMVGAPPQSADQRQLHDKTEGVLEALRGTYSDGLIDLVVRCLALDAVQRPQSVFALQKALADAPAPRPAEPTTLAGRMRRALSTLPLWFSPRKRVPAAGMPPSGGSSAGPTSDTRSAGKRAGAPATSTARRTRRADSGSR